MTGFEQRTIDKERVGRDRQQSTQKSGWVFVSGFGAAMIASAMFLSPLALPEGALAGEPIKLFDWRGGDKSGLAGYEKIIPPANISNTDLDNMQMAQASNAAYRIQELEERVRLLNGQIEDLTFQLLQMQEKMRKMQEDNEFRFQELEEKQGSLGTKPFGTKPDDAGQLLAKKTGPAQVNLGSIIYDDQGNITDTNINAHIGRPIDLTQSMSALEPVLPETPGELFDLGYGHIQRGNYADAVKVLESLRQEHSNYERLAEAQFWLAESYFSLGQYEKAAKAFLENHKAHPDAPLAAENLLKLGVALAGLHQRELACATYAEISKKYPASSPLVKNRTRIEQRSAKCKL